MITAQDHIHLALSLGPAPEYAPITKWKVRGDGWVYQPNIIADYRRTITGVLKKHVLKRDGQIARLVDHSYIIVVRDYDGVSKMDRLNALISMLGQEVYVTDSLHCENGHDHRPYNRRMVLRNIADIKNINPMLDPLYVSIELVDDTLA